MMGSEWVGIGSMGAKVVSNYETEKSEKLVRNAQIFIADLISLLTYAHLCIVICNTFLFSILERAWVRAWV